MIASWSNSTLCSPWSPWWCASRGTKMPSLTRSLLLGLSCLWVLATAPCVGIGPTVATMARAHTSIGPTDRFLVIFRLFFLFIWHKLLEIFPVTFLVPFRLTVWCTLRNDEIQDAERYKHIHMYVNETNAAHTHSSGFGGTWDSSSRSQHVIAENREILWTLLNSFNGFA